MVIRILNGTLALGCPAGDTSYKAVFVAGSVCTRNIYITIVGAGCDIAVVAGYKACDADFGSRCAAECHSDRNICRHVLQSTVVILHKSYLAVSCHGYDAISIIVLTVCRTEDDILQCTGDL